MCPRALKHFTSRSNTDATPTREALPLKSRGPRPSEHVGRGGVRLIARMGLVLVTLTKSVTLRVF